jgi:hypothetical protein
VLGPRIRAKIAPQNKNGHPPNWYDNRGRRRPRADWIPALLILSGILGYGKNAGILFLQ